MSKRNTTNRETRILDAAASLIAHYGYDKTTISEIAREAGVAKGAIYLHWPTKEELFDALITREIQRVMHALLVQVENDPQGGSLPRMYRHALLSMQSNPLICALYTQDSRVLGNYIHQQNASRYVERFWFGKSFVEYMQASGLIRKEIDPQGLAYVLSIIAYGFTSIETIIPVHQAPPLETIADTLDTLMMHGIAVQNNDTQPGKQALRTIVSQINQQYQAANTARINKDAEQGEPK
jgi:TetR/AcrR family acrAB operon transcriptional repressor